MTEKEDKTFIIIVVVVLSITQPWTIPIWIILGLLFGILYLFVCLVEKHEEKKKQRKIPTTNNVSDEDFKNALIDWNKNRRRGNMK